MSAPSNALSPPLSCPLCGQPNGCAMAAGLAPESCWCMARVIDPAVLAAVPSGQRGTVCICPACGTSGVAKNPAAPPGPPPSSI